ncbi:MAG: phosphate transporter permease subunit PstC [Actinomycetia bacterium]|nr:phosphate transporter permease subunit PstC [Actinomycetes bacterium]
MTVLDARPIADAGDVPLRVVVRRNPADRVYRGVARGGGVATLTLMGFIGGFLLLRSFHVLNARGFAFLTEKRWLAAQNGPFGIAAVLPLTFEIAIVAIVIAVPVATVAALFLTEYAPRRVRRLLTSLVDLLAAVPSLIYGLWGLFYLQPHLVHVSKWLSDHLGFIPFFHVQNGTALSAFTSSTFIAGVVVSLMVVPVCTTVMREVFAQAPQGEKEGALALGATKWGVVRTVVLPFGRGGMIGGTMLGLGRALGETIAVTFIISPFFQPRASILANGTHSISALIALNFSESVSNPTARDGLIAAGLALFVVTLGVNAIASTIVARSRSGASTEI